MADGRPDGPPAAIFSQEPRQAAGRRSVSRQWLARQTVRGGVCWVTLSSSLTMVCGRVMRLRGMVLRRPSKTVDAMRRKGHLRPIMEGLASEVIVPKAVMIRDLPQGARHGEQPGVEKAGPEDQRGRLISRTKGGMNTNCMSPTMPSRGRSASF